MKTTVLAIVLVCALVAGAQDATQTQPAPGAGGQTPPAGGQAAPEIKDPAEYNAYVSAVQQKDNNAKISGLEAFLTQYPNSVMKTTGLELLMGTYQQTGNQAKVVETAKRLLTADPNNLRALALLTFLARQAASTGQNAAQNLADLQQYCTKGLDAIKANQKPAGMSDADFEKLKKQVELIFNGGCGFAALQNKDYQHAQTYLRAAIETEPNDLQNVYPLALAYLTANPPDSVNGLFFIARAANLAAGSAGQAQIESYGRKAYKNYHGSEEGWNDGPNSVMAKAKASPSPAADFSITKYVPPTPAQQAAEIIKNKTDADIKQMPFGEWELVLAAGTPDDQNKVWNVIKGVPLQMEATVLEATSPTELHIAATEDDIEQKRVDITLTMSGPIPPRLMPKVGDTLDFEGTPTNYTPTPFMMTMENGKLLKKAGATPAPRKPPVRRRPASKPQ
jgi:tetratricopeptide (TPR) repeat protein